MITELTLRLHGIPEHAVVLRIAFPDVAAAARAAVAIVGAGVGVTRVELIDGWTASAINAHEGTDLPPVPTLFVEADGSEQSVASDLELVRAVAAEEGAEDVVAERDPTARARLWAARHAAAHAAAAAAPGKRPRATDVCVPAVRARRHGLARAGGGRPAWPRGGDPRPCGRRERPRRPARRPRRPGRVRRGGRARRRARHGCARARRDMHGRARHRARQAATRSNASIPTSCR